MIVLLKKLLAETIGSLLGKAKVITSDYDEDNANKPQTSIEVRVIYQRSTWLKSQNQRVYDFLIEVDVKDLRTDDKVQNIIDDLCYGLLVANTFKGHLDLIEDKNEGYSEGIWTYQIILRLTYPSSEEIRDCMGHKPIIYTGLEVSIYPSYEPNLDKSDNVQLIPIT